MMIQDHSNDPDSNTLLPRGSGILLDAGGQAIIGERYVPKIRKPYTITKQRERWTEEEHKKFLEALKLYGRAWRKIEDHVGTKSAVQIRSHAQKFFSKVVREADNSNSSSVKPIEIPPPRPKRKPIHPYPRKLVIPVKRDTPIQEQSARSISPNSSVDQEHQSPTSVLSAVASDTVGSIYSSTPDGSSSPVSYHDIIDHRVSLPPESDPMVQENASQSDEPVSVKLELFPKVGTFTMEGSVEATLTKSLKLFGKTMLIANSEEESFSSPCLEQETATKLVDFAVVNAEYSLTQPPPMEVGPAPLPLRAFCGGIPFLFIPFDNINSTKEEVQDQKTQKEGSWSGSKAGSVSASGNSDKNQDTKTISHQSSLESTMAQKILAPVSLSKPSANLKRASSEKYTRAFVPYKRSLSEKGTQSSKRTGEDDETQRTRLCL